MARKNGLIRRRKASLSKKFDPIVLDPVRAAHTASSHPAALPLVLDDSAESYPSGSTRHSRKGKKSESQSTRSTRQSNVSALSETVLIHHDTRNAIKSECNGHDKDDHKETEYAEPPQSEAVDLDDLSRLKLNEENPEIECRSKSNVSSTFSEGAMSSEYFRHFFDDDNGHIDRSEGIIEDIDKSGSSNSKSSSSYRVEVPLIVIPRSEQELFKKVKPAYKHHLEMIDDDGSITHQVEQQRKRREREKQQQKMKQFYANSSHRESHRDSHRDSHHRESHREHRRNGRYLRSYRFHSKPLGFQINESPESIFVTNVYDDRGSAHEKGISRGWRIVEVNGRGQVKGMMDELRNNNGPFNITFDTLE